jgi:outer membrane protein
MTTITKAALIACLCLLPTFAFAADKPAGEAVTVPQHSTVTATPPQPPAAATPTEAPLKPTILQTTRIGYVDIARIGTESERGKTLKGLLTTKKEQLQGKIESKKKQLEKLKTTIEAKIASMSPAQREAKSKEFQKKLEELQKLAQASEGEFIDLQDKETRSLYEAIEQAAVAYGKDNGFSLIVVKKELLYIANSVDAQNVTEALIKALNQNDQKK